jgi:endonuclease YncB( thermonuclease family)
MAKYPHFTFGGKLFDAECEHMSDGDSGTFNIEFENGKIFATKCRLRFYDSSEIHDKDIDKRNHAISDKQKILSLIANQSLKLRLYEIDNFGRILIDVYNKDNIFVNREMLLSKHGAFFVPCKKDIKLASETLNIDYNILLGAYEKKKADRKYIDVDKIEY